MQNGLKHQDSDGHLDRNQRRTTIWYEWEHDWDGREEEVPEQFIQEVIEQITGDMVDMRDVPAHS
ncbi:hypothetical protein ACERK3_14145 [Phycisphaerales bacterium AB-hyl4]|uniref:Uncharacterized protein n=1 Tax=Natronomicrosphaera hydrolytica TaxID=3242702 RepID=A0ABV4U9M9_9BACT